MTQVARETIVGPLRQSVNNAAQLDNSIHNDEVASKLGFRGGTVAGSIHLELFPPLCVQAFGEEWFDRGTLSINFRNATTDREEVRASLETPATASDVQVAARIERADGMLVGEGTASVGSPDIPTALQAIDHSKYDAGELRLLAGVQAGDEIAVKEIEMSSDWQNQRMSVITEPLDWYTNSPWGGPVASPATIVQYLFAYPASTFKTGRAVGLFGAIETRHVNGPLLLDRTYRMGGEIVAVGQSPKTEYVWFESYAESLDGERVAELLLQLRWMKASAKQYE